MGRLPIELDMAQLQTFMRFKPSLADCSAYFQISQDTIERRIREQFDLTFTEYREQHMVHTRMSLIQKALLRAEKSDTMLIFCLKNLCGWTSEGATAVVVNNTTGPQQVVNMTDDKMIELIKAARGSK